MIRFGTAPGAPCMLAEVGVIGYFTLRRKIYSDWHLDKLIQDMQIRVGVAAGNLPVTWSSTDNDYDDHYDEPCSFAEPDTEAADDRPPRIQVKLKVKRAYAIVYKEFAYDQEAVEGILANIENELRLQFKNYIEKGF